MSNQTSTPAETAGDEFAIELYRERVIAGLEMAGFTRQQALGLMFTQWLDRRSDLEWPASTKVEG